MPAFAQDDLNFDAYREMLAEGNPADEIGKGQFLKDERGKVAALAAYVVTHSKGEKISIDLSHPKMKEMYALGERAFYLGIAS